jgi:hypothetical protein
MQQRFCGFAARRIFSLAASRAIAATQRLLLAPTEGAVAWTAKTTRAQAALQRTSSPRTAALTAAAPRHGTSQHSSATHSAAPIHPLDDRGARCVWSLVCHKGA